MRYLKTFESFDPSTEQDVTHYSVIYDRGGDESYPQPWLKVSTDKGEFYSKLRKLKDFEEDEG